MLLECRGSRSARAREDPGATLLAEGGISDLATAAHRGAKAKQAGPEQGKRTGFGHRRDTHNQVVVVVIVTGARVIKERVGVGTLSALRQLLAEVSDCMPRELWYWQWRETSPTRIGERSMRHRRDPHREMPARRVLQSDLFVHAPTEDHPDPAVWWALPEEARRSLTGLLARLLLEHGANARRGGGRHDRR